MPGIAKTGDLVQCICCCHPPIPCVGTVGILVTGEASVLTNGAPTVRISDMAICGCGHPTFVVGGSSSVFAGGSPVARLGDPVAGCPNGTIISASSNVLNNK